MEFWNNMPFLDTIHPFRITLGINKDSLSNDLRFNVDAQKMPINKPWPRIWEERDSTFSIPVGQWMTLEVHFKEGDSTHGHFSLAVTPDGGTKQVIFDITNYTHHPDDPSPDGLASYNPMKLYTSKGLIDYVRSQGGVLEAYWDDFELWKDTNFISVTGISEHLKQENFILYPNPMHDKTVLTFDNPGKRRHILILYDVQGRVVKTISNITNNKVIIEKGHLLGGLYFFSLFDDEKIIAKGKLIIE
jgi:Secretion system C-terminal sorting domain